MRGRLALKILIAFWATFFCIIPAIWVPLALSWEGPFTPGERLEEMSGRPIVSGEGSIEEEAKAESGSTSEADGLLASLLAEVAPWGQILLVGGVVGVGFSIVLTRYLVRPVHILQTGFERLEQGEFGVRISTHIGNRRDEIADLAQDFDEMAERIETLVTARDRLLHDVSHELRSPLSRLQLAIALLRQKPERQTELLKRIEHEGQLLSQLVGEVLSLARAESKGLAEGLYYDPSAVVQQVVEDARFEAEANGVIIECDTASFDEALHLTASGSGELFARAIENVARNAIRHSSSGSVVTICTAIEGSEKLTFSVQISDSGPGVAEDALADILKPFERRDKMGFGLGLAIAQRAVTAHGGTIELSNRERGGLRVTIRLPVQLEQLNA